MKLSDSALTVLKARYFIGDEDWSGLCRRVSNHVANGDEELAEEYYNAIYNQYFLPNSPALMNAGTSIGNLSACFVRSPKDSMESIMETAKEASLLFKSGGGVGMDFSKLREKDAPVKETSGVASGAVSFMEIFNTVAEVTKQGGKRRAAMMGSLRIDHPEILDFITVKNDRNKLNNFNLSVAITDDFMGKVKDNEYYDLISPHSGDIIGQLKAGDIFDFIALNAHKHGEPGLLFIDEMNKRNPIPQLGKIETTNPCFNGDCKLLTEHGYRSFSELYEQHGENRPFRIINNHGDHEMATVMMSGVKETIELKFGRVGSIVCTPNHIFFVNGKEVEAKDMLNLIPDVPVRKNFDQYSRMYEFFGFMQGDGNLTRMSSKNHSGCEINIGKKDIEIIDYFNNSIVGDKYQINLDGRGRAAYIRNINNELSALGFSPNILPERVLPSTFDNWSNVDKKSFIRGLYSANGSVVSGARVALKSTCRKLVEQISEYLKSLDITSYITTNKPKKVKFPNGEYCCKESYDLNISKIRSIVNFGVHIGFIHEYKSNALIKLINKRAPAVSSIKPAGISKVYDFTCQSHKGVVDGCVVHNCGEIPAIDGSACVLSSLNISNIDTINNLDKYVRLAVRFLNGIIEVGTFPVSKITEVAKTTRQIGLGIMGWADYLAQRGIVYGSNEAIFEANRLISRIKQIAHDESVMIAIEKNEFIDTIDGKRYNGTLLSIAPTGTISMIADCSSSIEPYFALAYNKNVMDGESFTYLNEYLERDLRKLNLWTKDIVNDIVSTGSIQHIKVIPEHIRAIYRTANEISIEEHIKMQAAFQNHVCQAVSKTINLKQGAGIQDVKDAYLLAYELGCKGITVYRDGSRGNQVLTTKQTQSEVCPDCNSELVIDGGCRTCKQCGWSACNI